MLFVNPHLPWFGFGQMYEAHLRSDEGWVFSGATMFGSCMPTLGHNEYLGWTFTTNEPDIADLWRDHVRRPRASAALPRCRRLSRSHRVGRNDQNQIRQ